MREFSFFLCKKSMREFSFASSVFFILLFGNEISFVFLSALLSYGWRQRKKTNIRLRETGKNHRITMHYIQEKEKAEENQYIGDEIPTL